MKAKLTRWKILFHFGIWSGVRQSRSLSTSGVHMVQVHKTFASLGHHLLELRLFGWVGCVNCYISLSKWLILPLKRKKKITLTAKRHQIIQFELRRRWTMCPLERSCRWSLQSKVWKIMLISVYLSLQAINIALFLKGNLIQRM